MNISAYFEPFEIPLQEGTNSHVENTLGSIINSYSGEDPFPETENIDLVIIGVKEERNCVDNAGCGSAPDYIRNQLYQLKWGDYNAKIIDLGNLKNGHTINDTYFALAAVVSELINKNIVPIILGGSQDLTYASYKAYESLGKVVNIVSLDSVFDLGKSDDELNSRNYLNKIILHQPNFLFNYTNIGYQSYFVDPASIKLMNNLYFDVYRLGKIRENIEFAEPLIRNGDLFTVDVSAIRQSDAPANKNASPNGFHGEEACQIMWYAGLSDKLTSLGLYELNPQYDQNNQTAKLYAQMIWYFIEGFYNRKQDHPYKNTKDYVKYTVSIKDHKDQLVFYKSKKSDRWWMDVPVKKNLKSIYERHHLIPCAYSDYETACKDDIPDRWWQAYQKLM
ncbi:MAG: formimidoylglutamase [Bacteroidales bacterium]|nr:formimidoylglutamase [Bacteroidales bacterium]